MMSIKLYVAAIALVVLVGCSQSLVEKSPAELTNQIGRTIHYRLNTDLVVRNQAQVPEMTETAKSVINQRLEKKDKKGFKVNSDSLDPRLITVTADDPFTFVEANTLVAPLHISMKEPLANSGSDQVTWQETGFNEAQIQDVEVRVSQEPSQLSYQIVLKLNTDGQKKIAQITQRNIGKSLGIFLDDEMISQPMIQSEISGNELFIVGEGSDNERTLLLNSLKLALYNQPVGSLVSLEESIH